MSRLKKFVVLVGASLVLTGCSGGLQEHTAKTLTEAEAREQVNALIKSGEVSYKTVPHTPDDSWVGSDTTPVDLPRIDKYPLSVEGNGQLNVEVFSSTEKAHVKNPNDDKDRWLDVWARRFNEQNLKIDGKRVSVSVRPVASGLAMSYITSGAYAPDAYSPANDLWIPMIESAGVQARQVDARLTGNVAGILMTNDRYKEFIAKYGEVTMPNVVKAVMAGDLKLGHTDPNQSSTGLNILVQELLAIDANNPASNSAAEKYRQFQANVPPVSPTTDEMIKVAKKGLMDAMIMESQAFSTEPAVATGWTFTPMGVRHDSPLYALNSLQDEKVQVLKAFADFVKSPEAQKSAESFGFNQFNDYKGVTNKLTGNELNGILGIWKQYKDAGVPVVTVFVVDCSGSMDGNKLPRAKQAFISASNYINPDNYVGVVSYSGANDIQADLPIGKLDDKQHSLLVGAVNSLELRGGTATNSAIVVAIKLMLDETDNNPDLAGARLRVIVMSDGQQNEGLRLGPAVDIVKGLKIAVYGVGFEADLKDLTTLAEQNEGYAFSADSEDGVSKLIALVRLTS